jgi:hypothetical protein
MIGRTRVPDKTEPRFQYFVYGLRLSSNIPIPNLFPSKSPAKSPCIDLDFGHLPVRHTPENSDRLKSVSSFVDSYGEPALRIWEVDCGAFLRIRYCDGIEFWVDRNLEQVWAQWPANLSVENTLTYFVGPVLGLLLRYKGLVCLHASVVAIHARSVILVGPEGAGKSTTAGAFATQGFSVLSDDIAALAERDRDFVVFPAYPRLHLWPGSVKMLYGTEDALPQIASDWDKRFLALGQDPEAKFEERALPIGAIYIFGDLTGGPAECVEEISQRAALMMLVANTYGTNFLNAAQRADEFAVLSRLVASVPVRKINPRRDLYHVNELCDKIRRDFEVLRSSDKRFL